MRDKILKFQIFSVIFVWIVGTLLHFTFEWFGNNIFVGAFSAVNESTWEHLKLVFYPSLLITIIGYFYLGTDVPNFLCSKLKSIIISISFIIIFFYTYTGILGTNFALFDIGSFFISIILGEYFIYKDMLSESNCNNKLAIVILLILTLCFIVFTYFPPHIGLFKDPVSNTYGIQK